MLVAEAILGVSLGVVGAAVWLALKPVTIVDVPPTPEELTEAGRHSVYFLPGRDMVSRPAQWQARHRAFVSADPAGVELQEQDLNRWIAVNFDGMDLQQKWESFSLEVRRTLPIFRFDGDVVEVGAMGDIAFMDGFERKIVVQARGGFVARDGRFDFVPDKMWIGSCPVPFPRLAQAVYDLLAGPYEMPQPDAAAWSAVRDVRIEKGRMLIGFGDPAPRESQSGSAQVSAGTRTEG